MASPALFVLWTASYGLLLTDEKEQDNLCRED